MKTWKTCLVSAVLVFTPATAALAAVGDVLVGDPFIDSYNGWVDTYSGTPQAGQQPNWGIHLRNNTLMESSDGRAGDGTTTGGLGDGKYTPFVMVNTLLGAQSTYNITGRIGSVDNDGFGLVFGFQNNDNYFRVGMRQQASGSVGFPAGLAVQKVVGGVITQIGTDAGFVPNIDGTPHEVDITVINTRFSIKVDGSTILSGNDADLGAGTYGVMSWAQKQVNSAAPQWGTELHGISFHKTGLVLDHSFESAFDRVVLLCPASGSGARAATLSGAS